MAYRVDGKRGTNNISFPSIGLPTLDLPHSSTRTELSLAPLPVLPNHQNMGHSVGSGQATTGSHSGTKQEHNHFPSNHFGALNTHASSFKNKENTTSMSSLPPLDARDYNPASLGSHSPLPPLCYEEDENMDTREISTGVATSSIKEAAGKQFAPEEIPPRITNVMGSVNYGVKLNLRDLAMTLRNIEWKAKRPHEAMIRMRDPPCTIRLYNSGKATCLGAATVNEAKIALRKIGRQLMLRGRYGTVRFGGFQVVNVVGDWDAKVMVNLEVLSMQRGLGRIEYESELNLGGVKVKLDSPKVAVTVYHTGKVKVMGARSAGDVAEAIKKVHPAILSAQKK